MCACSAVSRVLFFLKLNFLIMSAKLRASSDAPSTSGSRTRSSASATVLFIFQFPAIITFRSFFMSNSRKEHDHRARLGPVGIAGNRLCCLPRDDVMRGVKGCVDPAAPWVFACLNHPRQLKIERLPIGVHDQVKEQLFPADFHGERNAVRRLAPVRLAKFHAVPGQVRTPEKPAQAHALALGLKLSQNPSRVEQGYEPIDICMFRE